MCTDCTLYSDKCGNCVQCRTGGVSIVHVHVYSCISTKLVCQQNSDQTNDNEENCDVPYSQFHPPCYCIVYGNDLLMILAGLVQDGSGNTSPVPRDFVQC